ncbi:MAG: sugar phosphate isomerase/epimerase [Meiothermus sp.]|uniref:sugar phosphate isomerase/epimerase family protein n=1 Tax=Meiothermus sp. TaxID=1955249 RepID=UPI00298F1E49|nr:sugar phosphate isomerase/epimerase [Meiothermus sp.]MDW8091769.1 sugar phosphate isomerase/epimerase [Meiothermus sp.]
MDARLSISTARLWAEGLEPPLRLARESDLGLEISLHPGYLLDEALFEALAGLVHRPSVHLPHQGLDPLSPDPELGALSLRRLLLGLRRAAQLGADRAVFHSGIPYGHTPGEALARARRLAEVLRPVVEEAGSLGIRLLLENSHEPTPEALLPLLESYPEAMGFCFDAAHARVFSRLPQLAPWLALRPEHLHLNDTDGLFDRHWNLGQGVLDHASWLPAYLDRTVVLEVREDPTPSLRLLRRLTHG